jgi:DNA-binding transcriptional MerR regulator
MRRTGGRRFYRPRDVGVLAAVRRLLHEEGLSIRDLRGMTARAVLERAASFVGEPAAIAPTASRPERLSDLRSSLERAIAAKQRLDSLLSQSAD